MILPHFRGRTSAWLDKYLSGESIDYRQIIALYLPILIDQTFLVGLSLVNTAMISSSGVEAVSAVNMIDSINMFLISTFIAVATGGTIVVAQYKGSGNDSMVSKAAVSTISAVFLFALGISLLVGLFHNPMLRLLFGTASPDVLGNAQTYLIGSSFSYVAIGIQEAVSGALRGIGKTRVSLVLSLIMNLTYVLLNVLFINVLHMGVFGMAIAANISRYSAAAFALFFLVKIILNSGTHQPLKEMIAIKLSMVKRILFIGFPFAMEQIFFNGGKILTQVFVVSLGTYAIATNAICSSLVVLLQIPSNALAITAITVVGQCMGRRNIQDARKFTKSFLWLSVCSFVLMASIFIPLFHPLVGLFHPPAAIVDDIFNIVLITTIAQIFLWPISFLLPSALRAAGDSKFTSVTAMLSMWLFRIVFGYLFGIVLKFGLIGVWVAMNCEWGVRGLVFWWRFAGDRWCKHRLIESSSED